jgi:hypothetical protein
MRQHHVKSITSPGRSSISRVVAFDLFASEGLDEGGPDAMLSRLSRLQRSGDRLLAATLSEEDGERGRVDGEEDRTAATLAEGLDRG